MTPTLFSQRMRKAREAAGLTLADATFVLRARLPNHVRPSLETIRRLETGFTSEEKADPVIVAALAKAYGRPISELSPIAAEAVEQLRSVLYEVGGDLPSAQSGWTAATSSEPTTPRLSLVRGSANPVPVGFAPPMLRAVG